MNSTSHFSFNCLKKWSLRLVEEKLFALKEENADFILLCIEFQFIMRICASLLSMWLLKPLEGPFSYQALHGGMLAASTAASHRTNETLKTLLEGVMAKLHVFMYVCACLYVFNCGKSKYLAVFSRGSSVLAFIQKVTVPKVWCRWWHLRISISSRFC